MNNVWQKGVPHLSACAYIGPYVHLWGRTNQQPIFLIFNRQELNYLFFTEVKNTEANLGIGWITVQNN